MDERARLEEAGIDYTTSKEILDRYNRGELAHDPVKVTGIPEVDGREVIDAEGDDFLLDAERAHERAAEFNIDLDSFEHTREGIRVRRAELEELGISLIPYTAYGVLNGGSATSYADSKKNRAFSPAYFDRIHDRFEELAPSLRGLPKGITPAFFMEHATGPSFMLLKMRAMLLLLRKYQEDFGALPSTGAPIFQMSSRQTETPLAAAYAEYSSDPLIAPLMESTGVDITSVRSAVQPLLSAFTPDDGTKDFFFKKDGSPLALPGGHGQNFAVLAGIYRALRDGGKRFVYLGNVDNMGFVPDPVTLGYFALSGKQAAFDFSFRTPVDVKGGVLVRDENDRLNCADIGHGISRDEVLQAEGHGKPILFNCASGLFDLDFLTKNVSRISRELPTRFSVQDKDVGRYSQAEQSTWEVIGLLDDFAVFGVDKYRRFLAAKLLSENLLTSGLQIEDSSTGDEALDRLLKSGRRLHRGLKELLRTVYELPDS